LSAPKYSIRLDYDLLESQYAVTLHHKPNSWFSSSMRELLEQDTMNTMVTRYAEAIRAYGPDVAGTYFCSMFSRVCAAFQYSLTHHNEVPDMSLDNMLVHMYNNGGFPGMIIQLICASENVCPSPELRNEWRNDVLREFFQGMVRPLIESLASAVKLTPTYLWGIIAQSVPYYKEMWLKGAGSGVGKEVEAEREADNIELHNRIEDDFLFLRDGLEPTIFGIKKNPFNIKYTYVEHPKDPTLLVPLRPVCCLAFRTHTSHGYCYVCPRISEEERAAKRER
jgi:uncharacterized membrane protein YjfL (UPF0719 family)